MNYLAHVAVALACDLTSPEELLGVVLPDLWGMAAVRFYREHLPRQVGRGMAFHYATDSAFHAHPAFVAGSGRIRQRLALDGLATGPRRASAHVGWELLLDGSVFAMPNVVESFTAALSNSGRALSDVPEDEKWRWMAFATQMRDRRDWEHFDDPAFVAARIHRILEARPRLALQQTDVPRVFEALQEIRGSVAEQSSAVVADVAQAVSASDTMTRGTCRSLEG